MKLAYRVCIVTLILFTFVFAVSAQTTTSSNRRSVKDDRNTAPTLDGPTGLFTVVDGDTLRKGEFTFSGAYSNRDRDPGNVDIVEIPLAFQYGLTNRVEIFINTEAYRAIKVNSPRNLSGFYLPNSSLNIGGINTSGPAIILAPSVALVTSTRVFCATMRNPFHISSSTGFSPLSCTRGGGGFK